MKIPLLRIMERYNDPIVLADENYEDLFKRLNEAIQGGRQIIVPFDQETK